MESKYTHVNSKRKRKEGGERKHGGNREKTGKISAERGMGAIRKGKSGKEKGREKKEEARGVEGRKTVYSTSDQSLSSSAASARSSLQEAWAAFMTGKSASRVRFSAIREVPRRRR